MYDRPPDPVEPTNAEKMKKRERDGDIRYKCRKKREGRRRDV
jgi:hypothetical protein